MSPSVSMNRELNRSIERVFNQFLSFRSIGQIGSEISDSYRKFCLFFLQLAKELIQKLLDLLNINCDESQIVEFRFFAVITLLVVC